MMREIKENREGSVSVSQFVRTGVGKRQAALTGIVLETEDKSSLLRR